MKKFLGFSTIALACMLAVPGCGSDEPVSISDGVELSEVEKYDAMIAEESAGMEEDPPADE